MRANAFLLLLWTAAHQQAAAHLDGGGSHGALRLGTRANTHSLSPRQAPVKHTTDGTCGNIGAGNSKGMHCAAAGSNLCCSSGGHCGDLDTHCGAGCQSEFGVCKAGAATARVTECGPTHGGAKCTGNECCSIAGFCGSGLSYCKSPDCQLGFGNCDASTTPRGADTSSVDRAPLGTVPYETDIYHCSRAGDIALTFDDGPYNHTDKILDQLAAYKMKATFFITGINLGKGAIDDPTYGWDKVVKRMVADGHQVASHTWSHADLSKITREQRRDELVKLEMAMRNILGNGYIPTYIRPPYSSCTAECKSDLKALGYHITYFDLDTDDYNQMSEVKLAAAQNRFAGNVTVADPTKDDFLVIAHDIQELTATRLTAFMLKTMQDKGFRGVTVGECLNDPRENWYRGDSNEPVRAESSSGKNPDSEEVPDVAAEAPATGTPQSVAQASSASAPLSPSLVAGTMGIGWVVVLVVAVCSSTMVFWGA